MNCDCQDYCAYCHPEMCGAPYTPPFASWTPRYGDSTVVESWDGARWNARTLYWNGIAYVSGLTRRKCAHVGVKSR